MIGCLAIKQSFFQVFAGLVPTPQTELAMF
jgi:hypothetical protein